MKENGDDTGTAQPLGAAQAQQPLRAERLACRALPSITAEQRVERLARMAALAQSIRMDAAKLLIGRDPSLRSSFLN